MKLTIELVPQTSWYANVRSNVSNNEWDKLRRKCYNLANYRCEICGGVDTKHPVECHEIWEYDDKNHVQKLTGLISLCPNCHKTKHPGLAKINNEEQIVINQLMKVNKMSNKEAISYIEKCFLIWRERSKYEWEIDFAFIINY